MLGASYKSNVIEILPPKSKNLRYNIILMCYSTLYIAVLIPIIASINNLQMTRPGDIVLHVKLSKPIRNRKYLSDIFDLWRKSEYFVWASLSWRRRIFMLTVSNSMPENVRFHSSLSEWLCRTSKVSQYAQNLLEQTRCRLELIRTGIPDKQNVV